jgi:hypothetical protein
MCQLYLNCTYMTGAPNMPIIEEALYLRDWYWKIALQGHCLVRPMCQLYLDCTCVTDAPNMPIIWGSTVLAWLVLEDCSPRALPCPANVSVISRLHLRDRCPQYAHYMRKHCTCVTGTGRLLSKGTVRPPSVSSISRNHCTYVTGTGRLRSKGTVRPPSESSISRNHCTYVTGTGRVLSKGIALYPSGFLPKAVDCCQYHICRLRSDER